MQAAHKSEWPVAPGHIANQTINTADYLRTAQQRKAESTLIARLALAGHAVQKGRCDDYTVSKYGYSYYAQDFDALHAFAVRLGVCNA